MLKDVKIVVLITRPPDGVALDFLKSDIMEKSTVVLIGDGVFYRVKKTKELYSIRGHCKERGIEVIGKEIDFTELVKKIFEHDRVYVW